MRSEGVWCSNLSSTWLVILAKLNCSVIIDSYCAHANIHIHVYTLYILQHLYRVKQNGVIKTVATLNIHIQEVEWADSGAAIATNDVACLAQLGNSGGNGAVRCCLQKH